MADLGALVRELARTVDARALPAVYALVSVRSDDVRAWLRHRHLPFFDPDAPAGAAPRLAEVDRTADGVILNSQGTAATIGLVAGVAGALSVPPEVAAWIVACVRMGQRLAVVYGFDPATDRGQAALARAVAAGFEADLPERGLVDLRVSDLTRALARTGARADVARLGPQLARAVVWRSTRLATRRMGRLVPVLSSGVGAAENRRAVAEVGERMKQVLRRLAHGPAPIDQRVVEALEVRREPS